MPTHLSSPVSFLLFGVGLSLLSCKEFPRELDEVLSDADLEYAEACHDALLELDDTERAQTRYIESLGAAFDAPIAAFDLVLCTQWECAESCEGTLDRDAACAECLEERCKRSLRACRGEGWWEYESSRDEPLSTCWDSRRCFGISNMLELESSSYCYWSTRPPARLAAWRYRALSQGRCLMSCSGEDQAQCEMCVVSYAVERHLWECLQPSHQR